MIFYFSLANRTNHACVAQVHSKLAYLTQLLCLTWLGLRAAGPQKERELTPERTLGATGARSLAGHPCDTGDWATIMSSR
jgi:hypothetical protein